MLPQKRRVKKEQVNKILKEGRVFGGRAISLKTLFIPGQLSAFAAVISSKTAKKAAERNQLKRRCKAIIFKALPFVEEGFLTLVFLNKESLKMKFSALEEELKKLFLRAEIMH